jgi:hypothetical protein
LEGDKIIGERIIILQFYHSEFSTRTPAMKDKLTRDKQSVYQLYVSYIQGRKLRE